MFATVEIMYSVKKEESESIRVFPRQSSDIFQKIWNNNGGVQVQRINLVKFNENDQKVEQEQYYYIDSKNKINILYPNYDLKVERVKTMELISDQTSIKQKPASHFKKITYVNL